jgi:hypothetical protein
MVLKAIRLTSRGVVGKATSKETCCFRWMGCKVAVYDLTVQEKADSRGETSRARRGTKRRGRRSGKPKERKRRGVVAADPSKVYPLIRSRVFSRNAYLSERCSKWLERRLATYAKKKQNYGLTYRHSRDSAQTRLAKKRWLTSNRSKLVAVMARRTRESATFSAIRFDTYVSITINGWEALPRGSYEWDWLTLNEQFHEPLPGVRIDRESTLEVRKSGYNNYCHFCKDSWVSTMRIEKCWKCRRPCVAPGRLTSGKKRGGERKHRGAVRAPPPRT